MISLCVYIIKPLKEIPHITGFWNKKKLISFQPFAAVSHPKKLTLFLALLFLWITSFGLALGPLVIGVDTPFINQKVFIKQNPFFKYPDVDYNTLKQFSTKLFTFHPDLFNSSLAFKEQLFEKLQSFESWTFLQDFLSKWTGTEYNFEYFKG